ncbi:MAG: glycosyltransferase family 2 protein [Actinomycetota bacterium]|nr:glycosyltransferase family 2 protein [Actinomycetota bacterium]
MDVAAIILTWNEAQLTKAAARSVLPAVSVVYVVDNGSCRAVTEELAAFCVATGSVLVRNDENLGYAGGNNRGISRALAAGHEGLLIMNNDAAACPGAVELLVSRLGAAPGVGVVAPTVVAAGSGEVLHTHCSLDEATGRARWEERGIGRAEIDPSPRRTGYAGGEAFLARAEVFGHCGGFDEGYSYYFEDVEWSLRVRRAGWELETVPSAVFTHVVGATMPSVPGLFHRARSRSLFLRRALGHSRWGALRRSAPVDLVVVGSLVRHGQIWPALRGEVAGWIAGIAARH